MGSKKIEEHEYPFLVNRQNPVSSSSSSSSPPVFNNLNITFSKKTMDEVWNDMCHDHYVDIIKHPEEMRNTGDRMRPGTLNNSGGGNDEDGFVQNPVVFPKIDHQLVRQWQQQQKFSVSENGFENKMMNIGYLDEQLKMTAPLQGVAMADKSVDSQGQNENKSGLRDERMAKTIERRQRRMIKNRESAARSRARKQAYTNQLQHSMWKLQTTNNLLKKRKEAELLLDSSSTSGQRKQLRRTSSCSF